MSKNLFIALGFTEEKANILHSLAVRDAHESCDREATILLILMMMWSNREKKKEDQVNDFIADAFYINKLKNPVTKNELTMTINWSEIDRLWSAECSMRSVIYTSVSVLDNDVCRAMKSCLEAFIRRYGVEISDAVTRTQPNGPAISTPAYP